MKNFQSYFDAVSYLESLSSVSGIKQYAKDQKPDYFIKKTRYFFNLLGNPQNDFQIIHITGTAGKGSTANYVQYLLNQNGLQAGLFTSPYATTSIEKIKVGDFFISPEEFVSIVNYLKPYIDKTYMECPYGPVSYFEIFFAIAILYFQRKKCKWIVLEVGLGGTYDATNIITAPKISVITNIDYDHTNILGKTLTKIAKDKAGIIKNNCIFITAEKRPHILKIFKSIAKKRNVKKFIKVSGRNEELAIAIAKEIGIKNVSLANAPKLPCRLEIMREKPLVVLDGAHNPLKISYSLSKIKKLKINKILAIVAISADKDYLKIVKEVASVAHQVFFTRFLISERECAPPKELLKIYKKIKPKGKGFVSLDPYIALDLALKTAKINDVVVVIGSFFLAGELRKYWHKEEDILQDRKI